MRRIFLFISEYQRKPDASPCSVVWSPRVDAALCGSGRCSALAALSLLSVFRASQSWHHPLPSVKKHPMREPLALRSNDLIYQRAVGAFTCALSFPLITLSFSRFNVTCFPSSSSKRSHCCNAFNSSTWTLGAERRQHLNDKQAR